MIAVTTSARYLPFGEVTERKARLAAPSRGAGRFRIAVGADPGDPASMTSQGARAASAVLLSGAVLSGCGGTPESDSPPPAARPLAHSGAPERPPAAPAGPLAGTEWRLVEIQSMDDSVGTRRPGDPAKFTMRLNDDNTVNMRLDCNRANGTWSVEPGADPSSGRIAFGPLAATRALCPPPRLDEQVTAQAPYIRGYMLKDGRLSLTLVADGGIWLWEQDEGIPLEPRS